MAQVKRNGKEHGIMNYGILVAKHNGNEIYQDNETFYVVDKHGELIGKSNCLNGAQIVSCLGKKEMNKLFKKGRKR